jgi:macrolide transport system ATP-binding/permease protein
VSLIELKNVSRHYSFNGVVVCALDDVNLRIEAGEMLAIMGASGSGKSTLVNLLGCLDKPSSGRVLVDDRNLAELSPDQTAQLRRETIGFVFQRYHLLAHLDAVDNVALPAIYNGLSSRQRHQRAVMLLQRLGLGERLSHKPSELSGGQQQRVSIARALMNGGRIILADEPTGALDSTSGNELLDLLTELNGAGHTVILVTHDANVAARAQRIIELRDGRIASDTTSQPSLSHVVANEAPVQREPISPSLVHWLALWREALLMGLAAINGNRVRSALSMLGISIGIAAVISIMGLGEAARTNLEDSAKQAESNRVTIRQGNRNIPVWIAKQPLTMRDAAALRSLPGVTAVTPNYSSSAEALHGRRHTSVLVSGMAVGDRLFSTQQIVQGRDISAQDVEFRTQVVVVDKVAREDLFAPHDPVLGREVIIGSLPFTVIGISGSTKKEDSQVASFLNFKMPGKVEIPQTTFTSKFAPNSDTDSLTVLFSAPFPTDELHARIRQRLLALHGGIEDFSFDSNRMIFNLFLDLLSKLTWVLTAIAAISLLVGGVGVMNIMLVSVSERTNEIGIRMALGARQRDVQRQFLIESVLLCCAGGLVGVALPWLAMGAFSGFLPGLTLALSWSSLALALGTCTAIGLLFGTFPACQAAKLSPVVALARD